MKDILLLAGRKPFPLDDGWRLRTYHLAKALTTLGGHVDLLLFDETGEGEECGELDSLCREIVIVPRSKTYSKLDLAKGILFQTPFSVLNYEEDAYKSAFSSLLDRNDYGYIQVEDIVMAQYALRVDGVARVLDMHNIESDLLRRFAEKTDSFLKRSYALMTANKLERYELSVAREYDGVLVCSAEEQAEFARKGLETQVDVIPNGVDCSFYGGREDAGEDSLVFVGSMDYHANISGIQFLARDIMPILRRHRPDLKVYVVGKNPPEEIKMLADEHFIVTGGVPDVRPYLDSATISIVPLTVGGGTRLKILEAMAAGLPVVSTSLGAEGLAVRHEQNILLGDTGRDFASCVLRLLDDGRQRAEIAEQGRIFVKENYDWQIVSSLLQSRVRELMEKRV